MKSWRDWGEIEHKCIYMVGTCLKDPGEVEDGDQQYCQYWDKFAVGVPCFPNAFGLLVGQLPQVQLQTWGNWAESIVCRKGDGELVEVQHN